MAEENPRRIVKDNNNAWAEIRPNKTDRGSTPVGLEKRKERSVIDKMMDNRIYGDLDDMIFADCDWQPSER